MKSAVSIHEQVRTDCTLAIAVQGIRQDVESLNPMYFHRVMIVDREGCAHAVIWNPNQSNFTEIHLHNESSHPIEFNYIKHE